MGKQRPAHDTNSTGRGMAVQSGLLKRTQLAPRYGGFPSPTKLSSEQKKLQLSRKHILYLGEKPLLPVKEVSASSASKPRVQKRCEGDSGQGAIAGEALG